MLFTVENDGFISKTTYNYDQPVFLGATPEEWLTIPETPPRSVPLYGPLNNTLKTLKNSHGNPANLTG